MRKAVVGGCGQVSLHVFVKLSAYLMGYYGHFVTHCLVSSFAQVTYVAGFQGQLVRQVRVTVSPHEGLHLVVQILLVRSANIYGAVGHSE